MDRAFIARQLEIYDPYAQGGELEDMAMEIQILRAALVGVLDALYKKDVLTKRELLEDIFPNPIVGVEDEP